jgi:hypothetical protein
MTVDQLGLRFYPLQNKIGGLEHPILPFLFIYILKPQDARPWPKEMQVSTPLREFEVTAVLNETTMDSRWAETETTTAIPHGQMARNGDNNNDG